MKKLLIGLSALLIIVLSGCISNTTYVPPAYVLPAPKDVKKLTVHGLCKYKNRNRLEHWMSTINSLTPAQINTLNKELADINTELKKRKAFNRREWNLIRNKKIQVGMSKNALLCSWGWPDKINRSSYGSDQYVYGNQYVYVRRNRVTAWN